MDVRRRARDRGAQRQQRLPALAAAQEQGVERHAERGALQVGARSRVPGFHLRDVGDEGLQARGAQRQAAQRAREARAQLARRRQARRARVLRRRLGR
jgi:hypothetical protein